jgi:hypothetical protein
MTDDEIDSEDGREEIEKRFPEIGDAASLTGHTDDPAKNAQADQYLAALLGPDELVRLYYERIAPGPIAAYLAVSRLPELQRIAEKAWEADQRGFSVSVADPDPGPGPWAIITSRPGTRHPVGDFDSLLAVVKDAAGDIACDLAGPLGYCVSEMLFTERHQRGRNGIGYANKHGSMFNKPFVFPFAYRDLIVLSPICWNCWIAFVKRNGINGAGIQEPFDTTD